MTEFRLKSFHFRREREATWRALEEVVDRAEKRGVQALSSTELVRLPSLYAATLSSLSVARSISLDRNVVEYLESLAGRAYFLVYGARTNFWEAMAEFFAWRLPAAVRRLKLPFAIALTAFLAGVAAGYILTAANADWFYSFVDEDLAGGRTPTASTEFLRDGLFDEDTGDASALSFFATYLFTHNAKIGMLCFALGFALGLPTIILLVQNGLMLGAFAQAVVFEPEIVAHLEGGVLQRRLDRVGRQLRRVNALRVLVRFDHQRDDAGGHAGGHAGAAQAHVIGVARA